MLAPALVLAAAFALLAVSVSGMLRGAEPFATWFYPMAWYPTLVGLDAMVRLRSGRWHMLARPRFAASALAWSVPFWLFFELANLRLANWYYVFVPDPAWMRWTGIVLSFATVLPAILLSRRLLESSGAFEGVRWRPFPVGARTPTLLQVAGVGFLALALAWPRHFFPLLWGAVTLLVDPWVYRRDRDRSLLAALERGRPAVIVQLLAGGLAIGLLWEIYNVEARGKWIYTVPGLEELKLFEMPLLGFLGFPVLALDGWAVWSALVSGGLAREGGGPARSRREGPSGGPPLTAGRWIWLPVAAACVAVALGMERRTIDSTTPTLADVVGAGSMVLSEAGHDAFSLAEAEPSQVARMARVDHDTALAWVERARLAALRGIGARNARRLEAAGIQTVEQLAAADPDRLARALAAEGAGDVRASRIRVWVRGASRGR